MTVHFSSGELLHSTDLREQPEDSIRAFAKVIENLGSVPEIRFCSIMDRRPCFVYVKMDKVDYIEINQAEYELFQNALNPAKEQNEA